MIVDFESEVDYRLKQKIYLKSKLLSSSVIEVKLLRARVDEGKGDECVGVSTDRKSDDLFLLRHFWP